MNKDQNARIKESKNRRKPKVMSKNFGIRTKKHIL